MYFRIYGFKIVRLCVTWFDLWSLTYGLEIIWNEKVLFNRGFSN